MLTNKQKAERDGKVGSSDAPVIAGVSPYKSPLALYYQFHGELPRYDEEESFEQMMGTKLEPVIADLVAEQLSLTIRRAPVRTHREHTWMVAHLDYEIVNHPNGPGVLEIKRRSGPMFDQLPDDITLQVAHQLAVTNRQWAKVAVMPGYGRPKVFDVERDKEIEEYLIELEARFLVRVEKGEPPDGDWGKDGDLLKKLYPLDTGRTIRLDSPEAVLMFHGLCKAKADLEEAEQRKTQIEGWLKAQMQDASICQIPGVGTLTWKHVKGRRDFDAERFKQNHPLMYDEYLIQRPGYRRFLIKAEKGDV